MAQISMDVNKVNWEANATISSIAENAKSSYASIVGATKGGFSSGIFGLGADVRAGLIGIVREQVPTMKQAVTDYVKTIENQLDKVKSVSTAESFKGPYADAIKNFVDNIAETCKCITSNLLAFNDELTKVETSFVERTETLASEINAQANELGSSFKRYDSQ